MKLRGINIPIYSGFLDYTIKQWLQWKLEKALTNLNKLWSYIQTHISNTPNECYFDSIQFFFRILKQSTKLHFHFHHSKILEFTKEWETEQTLPNTDLKSLFVESPHVIPEVPLQQRGHLILQHLSFLPSSRRFLTVRSDHSRHANLTAKNQNLLATNSQRFREERFDILFIEQYINFQIERERFDIRGFDATSS